MPADNERNDDRNVTQNSHSPHSQAISTEDAVFHSSTLRDIGGPKSTVDTLKLVIQELRGNLNKQENSVNELESCFLYVRFKKPNRELKNKALLQSLLKLNIIAYGLICCVPTPTFHLKILESLLNNAISQS